MNFSGTTKVTIAGGCIGTLIVNNAAEITMQGGTISSEYYAFDPENLDDDDIMRAPYDSIYLNGASTMSMSGGVVERNIHIATTSQVHVYGKAFQVIPDIKEPPFWLDEGNIYLRGVRLLGYWQNDQPLDLYFAGNSFDRVVLHEIPEPVTLVLLGLGNLFLRRKSQKQQ